MLFEFLAILAATILYFSIEKPIPSVVICCAPPPIISLIFGKSVLSSFMQFLFLFIFASIFFFVLKLLQNSPLKWLIMPMGIASYVGCTILLYN